jgi:Cu(I)/Ag(I) efflux system protein CusF
MKSKYLNMLGAALTATLLLGAGIAFAETADGQVQKVDGAAAKVTIKHGGMKGMGMADPMTMVYRVKDPSMLKAIKAGDKVKFDLTHDSSGYVVTHIEKK